MSASPPRSPRRLRLPRPRARGLEHQQTASVVEHLAELRWRLMWALATLIITFAAGMVFREDLFSLLDRPLDNRFRIQTLGVTEPFFTTMTVAAYSALVVSFPVLLYHGYRYMSPALAPWQRRRALPYLALAPALFGSGVLFGFFFVLGPAVRFLLGFGAGSFDVAVRAQEYYTFVAATLLALGLVFLFPLVLVALGRLEIVSSKAMRANRRWALLAIAIVATLLPTADPVSLLIEMAPLVVLYELSVWLVAWHERGRN